MRASPQSVCGEVAVMAEHAVVVSGEMVCDKEAVERYTSLIAAIECAAMSASVPLDMVNGKEHGAAFPAAFALPAIPGDDFIMDACCTAATGCVDCVAPIGQHSFEGGGQFVGVAFAPFGSGCFRTIAAVRSASRWILSIFVKLSRGLIKVTFGAMLHACRLAPLAQQAFAQQAA